MLDRISSLLIRVSRNTRETPTERNRRWMRYGIIVFLAAAALGVALIGISVLADKIEPHLGGLQKFGYLGVFAAALITNAFLFIPIPIGLSLAMVVADLIEAGVVTGKKKSIHPRKHVFTISWGTGRMYDFINDNPGLESYPVSHTNDPAVIAQNDNMISVNSILEVDLTGQCNAEFIAGSQYSGTGGQLDFVRGAFNSRGGKSILAFYSTAKDGEVSRVVPRFETGTVVTTPRMDTHYLVTEYGAVNLKAKSTRERALDIISIAHPKFRDDLLREAEDMYLL